MQRPRPAPLNVADLSTWRGAAQVTKQLVCGHRAFVPPTPGTLGLLHNRQIKTKLFLSFAQAKNVLTPTKTARLPTRSPLATLGTLNSPHFNPGTRKPASGRAAGPRKQKNAKRAVPQSAALAALVNHLRGRGRARLQAAPASSSNSSDGAHHRGKLPRSIAHRRAKLAAQRDKAAQLALLSQSTEFNAEPSDGKAKATRASSLWVRYSVGDRARESPPHDDHRHFHTHFYLG